jgi:hypothetical protein
MSLGARRPRGVPNNAKVLPDVHTARVRCDRFGDARIWHLGCRSSGFWILADSPNFRLSHSGRRIRFADDAAAGLPAIKATTEMGDNHA